MQFKLKFIFIFVVQFAHLNTQRTAQLDYVTSTDGDAARDVPQVDQDGNLSDLIQPIVESSHSVNDSNDGCHAKGDNPVITTGNGKFNNTTSTGNAPPNSFANGLVSPGTYRKVSSVSSNFTIPILVIALLCNLCSAVVYVAPELRSVTSIYLVFLACTGLVYVVCVLILEITSAVFGDSAIHTELYLTMVIYLGNYIGLCCRRLAYCVTALVSLERLIGIAFPLRARQFRALKSPQVLLPVTAAGLMCYHIFSPLKLRVIPSSDSNSNSSSFTMAVTTLYLENVNTFEIVGIVGSVFFVFLPLIACLLFNILIITCLNKHSKRRRSISNSFDNRSVYQSERQTTITLIVSTFIYVVLNLPVNVSSVVSYTVPEYGLGQREHYLFLLMNVVGYICEINSNITNLFSYLSLSSRFRRVLVRKICSCKYVSRSPRAHNYVPNRRA
ncbi:uncharacterized protein LOC125373337 [Haliotis rufescens]|uniref:uncharacterized protein LOC125373337 n=1 Tax=Haliotis rufescens TaxID=6454 RepID=UPI00201F4D33|nr:uncharacterized protein LOC125373337 [Haliotis rufescens]